MTPDDLEPLSADLKALLDAEKPISAAPAAAKARMLSRLSTELFDAPGGDGGGGSSQGGSGGSSAPAAPSGGVGAGAGAGASGFVAKAVVTKLVVGASVASLAVGGALGAGVHSVVATPKPVEQSTPAPVVVVKEPEKPVEPPPPPPVVEVPVEKVEPKVAPVAPKLSADEQLALEKSYVEQARAAMARQDTTAALEALGQHEKRFPKGQLTEERMALQVMALVSAGRSIEANNLATEFRRRFPNGLMRSVVDGALAQ